MRDTLVTEATETPRIQELTNEVERLKDRLIAQTRNEQANTERAVKAAREKEREELAFFSRQVQEVAQLPAPTSHALPEPDANRNIELWPLSEPTPPAPAMFKRAEAPEVMTNDEAQSNQRETMRTLSKLQREVFVFIKDAGPSNTD